MPLDPDALPLLEMMRAAGRPPMETLSPVTTNPKPTAAETAKTAKPRARNNHRRN